MMWKPAHRLARVVLCSVALLVLGCPEKTLRVGVVLPLTGEDSIYGEPIRKGLELAYEHLQAEEDGAQIVLSFADTESDLQKAHDLLTKQYDEGALVVIGAATSDEAKSVIDVIDRFDRVLLSPSASSPELTGISRNFYRIWPSDFMAATKMAQFASQDLKITKVVVLAEMRTYAKGIQSVFQPAFEGFGGEVLEMIEIPPGTSDLGGLIDRVFTIKPEAVYLAGFEQGIGAMIQELRRRKYQGRILTTSAFALPSAIARVGKDATGVILTQTVFELDSDHAHVQKFVKGYRDKYGESPNIYSAHGYDALMVMARAMADRPALPGEPQKGLRDGIKDFPGVTGSIQFDEKGDVRKFPRIYIIGEDLLLYDYNERVRGQQEEIRIRRLALMEKLNKIQEQAKEMDN